MTRRAGVPLLLINPVCNLRDCPPFKSEHRDGLTAEEKANWEALWAKARLLYRSDMPRAIERLQQAMAMDDQYAGLHYEMGNCWDAVSEPAKARAAYLRAKELDVCPLRILEPMNEAVLKIARQTGTPLVDARRLIERRSRHGIPGDYLLIDHVHPSIRGHQMIAEAIAEELSRLGFVQPAPGWQAERDRKFREHLASLNDFYYLEGLRHLKSLRGWARGKAILAPPQQTAQSKQNGAIPPGAKRAKPG
jgi:tetratricopeptide (TPR) repeat protein